MTPLASKMLSPVALMDDGDPHLHLPASRVTAVRRFRPNTSERLAILGGADLELHEADGLVRLVVVDGPHVERAGEAVQRRARR